MSETPEHPEELDEDATSGNRGDDESPGVPGEENNTSTGNPDAAGAEDPEEDSSGA